MRNFSFKGPVLNAAMKKNIIDIDRRARLHSMPHHINAMQTGMMVWFMTERAAVKKQNFYDGFNSPKLERKTGIYS